MSALTPLLSHAYQWPVPTSFGHDMEQFYSFGAAESSADSVIWFSSTSSHEVPLERSPAAAFADTNGAGGDQSTLKKIQHNASERSRRKKLNSSYSSLRSLLPPSLREKKLSIPATLSRVLQYLPELKEEVESLGRRKEELLKRISRQTDDHFAHLDSNLRETRDENSIPGITVSRLSQREIMVQIATVHGSPLSKTLLALEEYGLHVIAISSFLSSCKRIFHSIHLEMERNQEVDYDQLNKKLLSLYQTNTRRM